MTDNIESSLEWKKHDDFFRYLNTMLDETAKIEAKIYIERQYIYLYYAMVSSIMSKHKEYLFKFDEKDKKMKKIRTAIYSSKVQEVLILKKNNNFVNNVIINIIDDLVDIYRSIVSDIVESDLLPKVRKTDKNIPSAAREFK